MSNERRREPSLERQERLFIKQVFSGNLEYRQVKPKARTADLSAGSLRLISSRVIPWAASLSCGGG